MEKSFWLFDSDWTCAVDETLIAGCTKELNAPITNCSGADDAKDTICRWRFTDG